jgi:CheY-like chemotaxis protein/anti-sigma regulatory factor (Ser/Thr protein kinase)
VRNVGLAAEVKGQAIDLRIQDQASRLDADPVRLRQVLDNLLSNAVKYGERSTRITVEVWSEDDQVGVAVLDEGPGLTDEDFGRAFQEFARLSAQPTGGESSHGLGLSIVKRIVEQHGGRIWVENRADRKGARFAFLLPRAKLRDRPCRVLVVDDQVMNRLILKRLLERAGHEVEDVAGGAEAIRAAAEGTHDLVLMDVEMPGVDGLEATRRIRSQGRDEQTLPIIAVTGHSDPAHLSRCLDAGMNDAVTKPVEPGRLELVLRRWAPRRRAATKAA